MRRYLLIAVGLAAALVIAEIATSGGSNGGKGRFAPQLPTATLSGPRVTLADLRGKPAAVNFWASWCGPCKKEAPELERLSRTLDGRGRLVGIDWADSESNARSFVKSHGWTFSILSDPEAKSGEGFGLTGLPTTFVIDSRGRIAATLRGPQTERSIRAALDSAG